VYARRAAPTIVGGLVSVLVLLGGCGTAPEQGAAPGPTATAAVPGVFNAADAAFVRALLPHHREGIEIAEVGAARTTRADVKVLAQAIVATQQDEVTRMRGWLKAWQQPEPAPAATAGGKQIAALRTASTGFDQRFLDLLIAHQEQAVKLAQSEQAGGENPSALAFAKQIVQSRTAEIDQMQAFLVKT
jgi:uncharacterized protein (DUF305 family)